MSNDPIVRYIPLEQFQEYQNQKQKIANLELDLKQERKWCRFYKDAFQEICEIVNGTKIQSSQEKQDNAQPAKP